MARYPLIAHSDSNSRRDHAETVTVVRWRIDPVPPRFDSEFEEIVWDLLEVACWINRLGLTYTAFLVAYLYMLESTALRAA